jgi:hypothetical protein
MPRLLDLRRRLLVLLLLFTLTPSASEAVELVAHALSHGDYAHAADARHDGAPDGDEHGCTTMLHTCGCHGSAHGAAVTALRLAVAAPPAARAPSQPPAESHEREHDPPPLRPPIV